MMTNIGDKKAIGIKALLRSIFWPMRSGSGEVSKILSMFVVLFCIILNYSILRVCKDSLMINSSVLGAETLPFIKICGVTPFAFLFTALYIYLAPRFSRLLVFNITIIGFSAYFLFFLYWMFPHLELINLNQSASWFESVLPSNFGALISLYRNWSLSFFYILAELWSSVVMAYLFWEFANSISTLSDAKRFYGFFGFSGHLAYLVSGSLITYLIKGVTDLSNKKSLEGVLTYVAHTVFLSSIVILISFTYLYLKHGKDHDQNHKNSATKQKSHKKIGVIEGIIFVTKSPYLRCIALMIISYGFSIDLVEVVWKSQIKAQFPEPLDCFRFMAQVQIFTSVASTFYILICGPVLQRFGWGVTALITPAIMTVTSIAFYFLTLATHFSWSLFLMGTVSPLLLTVWVGLIQITLTKGAKNTLFMVTKEMAYIPLSPEEKTQGKAAVDVLCERFGRSGGALISMISIFFMGSISQIVPFSAFFTFVICGVWLWSTWSLKKMIDEKELVEAALENLQDLDQGELLKQKEETREDVKEKKGGQDGDDDNSGYFNATQSLTEEFTAS